MALPCLRALFKYLALFLLSHEITDCNLPVGPRSHPMLGASLRSHAICLKTEEISVLGSKNQPCFCAPVPRQRDKFLLVVDFPSPTHPCVFRLHLSHVWFFRFPPMTRPALAAPSDNRATRAQQLQFAFGSKVVKPSASSKLGMSAAAAGAGMPTRGRAGAVAADAAGPARSRR